jgi:hypothetical protein
MGAHRGEMEVTITSAQVRFSYCYDPYDLSLTLVFPGTRQQDHQPP